MKIRCGWCDKDMGEKPPLSNTDETTSICNLCKEKLDKQIQEMDKDKKVEKSSSFFDKYYKMKANAVTTSELENKIIDFAFKVWDSKNIAREDQYDKADKLRKDLRAMS